jgi:hypothetical protein
MDELDLEAVRRWLEHGDIKKIAIKCGLEPNTAYKYFEGKVKKVNVEFISACFDKAIANKRIVLGKQNSLNQLK